MQHIQVAETCPAMSLDKNHAQNQQKNDLIFQVPPSLNQKLILISVQKNCKQLAVNVDNYQQGKNSDINNQTTTSINRIQNLLSPF